MTRSARRWGLTGGATALAVALAVTAAVVPTAGAAADPPGPFTPPSDPAGGDAVIYPAGYPVAQLTLPDVAMAGGLITVVGDASTGDVVSQEVQIEGPSMFVTVPCGAPGPDCVVEFRTFEGTYAVTLTVFGPAGETTSDTEIVTVLPRIGCPPMCPQPTMTLPGPTGW